MKKTKLLYEKMGIEFLTVQFNLNQEKHQEKYYYVKSSLVEKGFILEEVIMDYVGPIKNQIFFEHSFYLHYSNESMSNSFLLASNNSYSFVESYRIIKDIFNILDNILEVEDILKILIEMSEDVINYERNDNYNTPEKFIKRLECINKRKSNEFIVELTSEEEIW